MKRLCVFIILLIPACTYTPIPPPRPAIAPPPDSYAQGRLDAERDYRANGAWILAGVGCGIFGVALAYLAPPGPPAYATINKSPEYTMGYRDGWRQKGRSDNAKYAALGWATWIVALVAVYQ